AACLLDVTAASVAPFSTTTILFPNWIAAPASEFAISECNDAVCTWCTASNLTGLTMANYGTAVGGTDLTRMYFEINCGKSTLVGTMTYVGVWNTHPSWTWGGSLALPDACASC